MPYRLPTFRVIDLAVLLASLCALQNRSSAQEPAPKPSGEGDGGLLDLSLEELMEVEVSVASRHGEPLRDVPAAVYVLTGDEIRRAGHTSIQEALRMVPGFHVAQWKTSGWDVTARGEFKSAADGATKLARPACERTARGFTGSLSPIGESFANQLLLIIDGVSVYSPAVAGIWWPLYDVPIDDIDRIEIIRGPAGTLWGTNAMNGVVNVITKHPKETTGTLVTTTIGSAEQRGAIREGGALGTNGMYRAYVSYADHAALPNSDGKKLPEDWRVASAGLRADWDLGSDGRTTFLTTMYASEFGDSLADSAILGLPPFDDTPRNGGYVLGSWEFGDPLDVQRFQGWYSADYQKQVNLEMDVQNADLEYTRHTQINELHTLTWGVGFRSAQTNLQSDKGFNDFSPEFRRSNGARFFAQDEVTLAALDSKLILGAQVEQADVGGTSLQPTVRWMWNASAQTSIWSGRDRARAQRRTPAREPRCRRSSSRWCRARKSADLRTGCRRSPRRSALSRWRSCARPTRRTATSRWKSPCCP